MATNNPNAVIGNMVFDPLSQTYSVVSGGGHSHNISASTFTATSPNWKTTIDADEIYIKGQSLGKSLDKINQRLAILDDPSPAKLEKYAALKEAYEHYKMLEMLINDEDARKN